MIDATQQRNMENHAQKPINKKESTARPYASAWSLTNAMSEGAMWTAFSRTSASGTISFAYSWGQDVTGLPAEGQDRCHTPQQERWTHSAGGTKPLSQRCENGSWPRSS